MTEIFRCAGIACIVLLFMVPASAAALQTTVPDTGHYVIRIIDASCGCPLGGPASVYFDGVYVGEITRGSLSVAANTTPQPAEYTIRMDGFEEYSGIIEAYPSAGTPVELVAFLVPVEPATDGNETGYYLIRCNVEGARVFFDDAFRGTIREGMLLVDAGTTGSGFRVEAEGYATFAGITPAMPEPGETLEIVVLMEPLPSPTRAPATPLSAFHACAGGLLGAIAFILRKNR